MLMIAGQTFTVNQAAGCFTYAITVAAEGVAPVVVFVPPAATCDACLPRSPRLQRDRVRRFPFKDRSTEPPDAVQAPRPSACRETDALRPDIPLLL